MSKIEVGDYVRTNKGIIGKIKRIELDKNDTSLKWYVFDKKRPDMNIVDEVYINKPYIVKHSKNIIDLIETEDFVNGYPVVKIRIDPFNNKKQLFTEHWDYNWQGDGTLLVFYEEDIKTVVTKEQFKNIEYKVGE